MTRKRNEPEPPLQSYEEEEKKIGDMFQYQEAVYEHVSLFQLIEFRKELAN